MWEVHFKGSEGTIPFEICVIRDTNKHGYQSYGWFGAEKILISHNGGPCQWPLIPLVWDKQMLLAQEVADELNKEESRR
jgi:hypothetical protein